MTALHLHAPALMRTLQNLALTWASPLNVVGEMDPHAEPALQRERHRQLGADRRTAMAQPGHAVPGTA